MLLHKSIKMHSRLQRVKATNCIIAIECPQVCLYMCLSVCVYVFARKHVRVYWFKQIMDWSHPSAYIYNGRVIGRIEALRFQQKITTEIIFSMQHADNPKIIATVCL